MVKPPERGFLARLSSALELPADIVLDLPKITIIGRVQVYLENHRGLVAYEPGEVKIRSTIGLIVITGQGLKIASAAPEAVVIDGRLDGLYIEKEG